MAIPTVIGDLSTTASSNVPAGSDTIAAYGVDDMFRAHASIIKQVSDAKANIANPTFTGTVVVPTPFTLGAVSVTATGTQINAICTDAELTAIAGLTSAADKVPYFTGSGTAAVADFTAAGRALMDDANVAAQLVTLGAATLDSPTFTGTVTLPTPYKIGAVSMTATGTELNHVGGVTSAIQTQLNAKAPTANPTFTGTVTLPAVTYGGTLAMTNNNVTTVKTLTFNSRVAEGTTSGTFEVNFATGQHKRLIATNTVTGLTFAFPGVGVYTLWITGQQAIALPTSSATLHYIGSVTAPSPVYAGTYGVLLTLFYDGTDTIIRYEVVGSTG